MPQRGVNRLMPQRGVNRLMPHSVLWWAYKCGKSNGHFSLMFILNVRNGFIFDINWMKRARKSFEENVRRGRRPNWWWMIMMIAYTRIPYFTGVWVCLVMHMGYWVSLRMRTFLRRHVYYGKTEFYFFPQCTHCSVKLHQLVHIVLDSSELWFKRLERGLGCC